MAHAANQSRHSSLRSLDTASESFPVEISIRLSINWSELALEMKPIFISVLGYLLKGRGGLERYIYNPEEILSLNPISGHAEPMNAFLPYLS